MCVPLIQPDAFTRMSQGSLLTCLKHDCLAFDQGESITIASVKWVELQKQSIDEKPDL